MANEEIDYEEKKRLAIASLKIIRRIYEISPQISDGRLHYFIAGSLATNILPLVKSMKILNIDKEGKATSKEIQIEIPEEVRIELLKLVRPSRSQDIDFVNVNKGPYECVKDEDVVPYPPNIRSGIEDDFDLIFPGFWEKLKEHGAMGDMTDDLESAIEMKSFHVAKAELLNGSSFYMPSLDSILFFKLREVSLLKKSGLRNNNIKNKILVKADELRKMYEMFSKINSPTLKKLIDSKKKTIEEAIKLDEKNELDEI